MERTIAASDQPPPPTPAMMPRTPFTARLSPGRSFVCGNLSLAAFKVLDSGADISSVVEIMPPWLVRLMRRTIRRNAETAGIGFAGNLTVSNVPGPRAPLFLNNHRLQDWFSVGQIYDGSNLNFTLWSYCDHANLCILADSRVIPDGWVLYDYFSEELDTLKALVLKQQTEQPA